VRAKEKPSRKKKKTKTNNENLYPGVRDLLSTAKCNDKNSNTERE
jgi:hypothetical protein